jgi:hypothetical protein
MIGAGVTDMIAQFFKSKGFKIVIGSDSSLFPEELIRNNCKYHLISNF